MTASNHILTGAVIALVVDRPLISIPLAFVSHFACDALPHIDSGDFYDVFERNKRKMFRLVIGTDIILSILLLAFVLIQSSQKVSPAVLAACMLAAFAPDVGIAYRYLRETKTQKWLPASNWLMRFHLWIEWEVRWGYLTEVAWFMTMIFLIFKLR